MIRKREICNQTTKHNHRDPTCLQALPDELILQILHNCSATTLLNLSQTSTKLRNLAHLPELWASLCKSDFNITIPTTTDARKIYLQLLSVLGSRCRTGGNECRRVESEGKTPWLSSCRIELNMRHDRVVWTNCRTSCRSSLKCERRRDMFCVEVEREGVRLKCLIQEREHNCQPSLKKTEDNKIFFSSNCLIPIVGCNQYFFWYIGHNLYTYVIMLLDFAVFVL